MLADEGRTGWRESIGHVRRIDALGEAPRRAIRRAGPRRPESSRRRGGVSPAALTGAPSWGAGDASPSAVAAASVSAWNSPVANGRMSSGRSATRPSMTASDRRESASAWRLATSASSASRSISRWTSGSGGASADASDLGGASSGYAPLIHDRRRFRDAGFFSARSAVWSTAVRPGRSPRASSDSRMAPHDEQVALLRTIAVEHHGQTDSLGRSVERVWSAMACILPRRGQRSMTHRSGGCQDPLTPTRWSPGAWN